MCTDLSVCACAWDLESSSLCRESRAGAGARARHHEVGESVPGAFLLGAAARRALFFFAFPFFGLANGVRADQRRHRHFCFALMPELARGLHRREKQTLSRIYACGNEDKPYRARIIITPCRIVPIFHRFPCVRFRDGRWRNSRVSERLVYLPPSISVFYINLNGVSRDFPAKNGGVHLINKTTREMQNRNTRMPS